MRKIVLTFIFCSPILVSAQPISLSAITDSILENNYAIRITRVEQQISENNNTPGRAGALPQVSIIGNQANSYYDTRQEFYSGDVRAADNAANNSLNAALRVDWTAFSGFRVLALKDNLRIQAELAQLSTVIALEQQLYSAASLYYEILLRNKSIAAYEVAVKLSGERKQLASDRLRLGRGNQLDVLQSQVDLNADSSMLMREIVFRDNLLVQLNTIMGREGQSPLELQGNIDINELPILQEMISIAQNQNTQVLQAKASKLLAYTTVRQAKSSQYPFLGIYGEYYYLRSQSQVGILKSNQAIGPGFGLSFSYRLFDGFNVKNDIENAKMQVDIQQLSLEKARQEIQSAVIQAYNNYLLNKQLWEFEKQNVITAEKNLEISQKQLELGVITDFLFREVQLRYTEAVTREIESQYMAKISELELHLLTANLLQTLKSG